jgi:DNA-binding MarR family transcriptional regulator
MCNYTYHGFMTAPSPHASTIAKACVCLGLRKAARLVTKRYDDAFRPLNITSGQFSILASMLRDDPAPLGALADALGMDRTTLTRNLKPLIASGLVAEAEDEADRRVRGLLLTAVGRDLMIRALDVWEKVQDTTLARLKDGWPGLKRQLTDLD